MGEVYIKLSQSAINLLEYLLFSNIEVIEPRVDVSNVSYPILGSVVNDESVFNELVVINVLEPVVADRFIRCPGCGSNNVRARLVCPKCGSYNIQRKLVIQHKVCGFTDIESAFKILTTKAKREVIYECPKCKGLFSLAGGECKELGRLYECQVCSYRTNSPNITFKCQVCGRDFLVMDAEYAPVFAYKINYNALMNNDVVKSLIVKDLVKPVADKLGINLREKYERQGSSGIVQKFDLILEKDSNYVALMFMFSDYEGDAINFLVKAADCNMRNIILSSGVRRISDYLKNISKAYNSIIIVGNTKDELREKLEYALREFFSHSP